MSNLMKKILTGLAIVIIGFSFSCSGQLENGDGPVLDESPDINPGPGCPACNCTCDSGDCNCGDCNTGNCNTGDCECGDCICESGDCICNCDGNDDPENDITPPYVAESDPLNNTTGVKVDVNISVLFSEAMNAASLNNAFVLQNSIDVNIDFEMTYNAATLTALIKPLRNLAYNESYKLVVNDKATDLAGNTLSPITEINFITTQHGIDGQVDPPSMPPFIVKTFPNNGAVDVSVSADFMAEFSDVMMIDSLREYITLTDMDNANVSITITHIKRGQYNINPDSNLREQTTYLLNISNRVQADTGMYLINGKTIKFSTGEASVQPVNDIVPPTILRVTPENLSDNLEAHTQFRILFSEPINEESLQNGVIFDGPWPEERSVRYDDVHNTYKITLLKPFAPDTTYTITLTPRITDVAGNHLEGATTLKYTTGHWQIPPIPGEAAQDPERLPEARFNDDHARPDVIRPAVVSTYPENSSTDFPVKADLSIQFNTEMDQVSTMHAISFENERVPFKIKFSHDENNKTILKLKLLKSLKHSTTYFMKISGLIRDINGAKMGRDVVVKFRTADKNEQLINAPVTRLDDNQQMPEPNIVRPAVVSTYPENSSTDFPVKADLSIQFNTEMDQVSSRHAISFENENVPFKIKYSYDENNKTILKLKLLKSLKHSTTYFMKISGLIRDINGAKMGEDVIVKFRTVAENE